MDGSVDPVGSTLDRRATAEFARQRKFVVAAFAIRMLVIGVEITLILPSVWQYVKLYEASSMFLGFVVAATPLSSLICLPLLGFCYDRTKRIREIILITNALAVAGNIVYSLHYSKWCPLFGRLISGAGNGFMAIAVSEVGHIYPADGRTGVLAVIGIAQIIGFMVGPLLNLLAVKMDFRIGTWIIDPKSSSGFLLAFAWLLMSVVTVVCVRNLALELSQSESTQKEKDVIPSPHCPMDSGNFALSVGIVNKFYVDEDPVLELSQSVASLKGNDLVPSAQYDQDCDKFPVRVGVVNILFDEEDPPFKVSQSEVPEKGDYIVREGKCHEGGGSLAESVGVVNKLFEEVNPDTKVSGFKSGVSQLDEGDTTPSADATIRCSDSRESDLTKKIHECSVKSEMVDLDVVENGYRIAENCESCKNNNRRSLSCNPCRKVTPVGSDKHSNLASTLHEVAAIEIVVLFGIELTLWLSQTILLFFLTPLTQDEYGWSQTYVSFVYLGGSIVVILVLVFVIIVSKKYQVKDIYFTFATLGLSVATAVLMLVETLPTRPKERSIALIAGAITGFAAFPLNLISIKAQLNKITRAESQGTIQAMEEAMPRTALVLGPLIGGVVLHHRRVYCGVAAAVLAVQVVLLFAVMPRILERQRNMTENCSTKERIEQSKTS